MVSFVMWIAECLGAVNTPFSRSYHLYEVVAGLFVLCMRLDMAVLSKLFAVS
jgi:hypothetical protein